MKLADVGLIKWVRDLAQNINEEYILNFLIALLFLAVGLFFARRLSSLITKSPRLDTQQRLLGSKIVYYGLLGLAVAASLNQLGLDLTVILGAAGILTVALGFAAQTSASNLISGLFLMVERPFVVGNVIEVAGTTGEVISIDLLSSKIRTFNNLMVRIPNETLVKSNITNHSYFPIRRVDLNLRISYSSDLIQVESLLRQIAAANPLCLDEPEPVFAIAEFHESAILVQFLVWAQSPNLSALKNQMFRDIQNVFKESNIEIPFPTRTLVSPPPSHS